MKNKSITLFLKIALNYLILMSPVYAEDITIKHEELTLNARLSLAGKKPLMQCVIVLVHGTLAHNKMETIKNLNEILNKRGFNTLSINLSLGLDERRGMYDCKIPYHHKHMDALDEISIWVDWLKSKGTHNIILLGHSRGGNQVTQFALNKKDKSLKNLILLAPTTWDRESAEQNFHNRHGRLLENTLKEAETL